MASIARERGISGTAQLKILHPREETDQLFGQRVAVEPRAFQREQEFVRRLERGKAAMQRLLLDDVAAWRRGREHEPRERLQARSELEHFSAERPGRIEQ